MSLENISPTLYVGKAENISGARGQILHYHSRKPYIQPYMFGSLMQGTIHSSATPFCCGVPGTLSFLFLV